MTNMLKTFLFNWAFWLRPACLLPLLNRVCQENIFVKILSIKILSSHNMLMFIVQVFCINWLASVFKLYWKLFCQIITLIMFTKRLWCSFTNSIWTDGTVLLRCVHSTFSSFIAYVHFFWIQCTTVLWLLQTEQALSACFNCYAA